MVSTIFGRIDLLADCLVHEIPDEASLIQRIFADEVPVLLEVTVGVAHRMRVLALDKRSVRVGIEVFLAILRRDVHRTINIRIAVQQCSFILYRTGRVISLDPIIYPLEVDAVAGLVSHTPDNHGRMVVVTVNHAPVTFHVGSEVILATCKGFLLIAHAVGLDIRLIHYIDTIFVTESVPDRVIRIVRSSYSIDIQLLHYPYIFDHLLLGNHVAAVRAHLVTVGTLDEYRLAVHKKLLVADFHGPEAERHGSALDYALLVGNLDLQCIKDRSLSRPELRILHVSGRAYDNVAVLRLLTAFADSLGERGHAVAARVDHLVRNGGDARCDDRFQCQFTIHAAAYVHVLKSLLLTGIDIHAACDSGESPEVLVLKISAVAPSEDFQGNAVFTRMHIRCDVETCFELAVFAVADFLAVHPYTDIGCGGTDGQAHLMSFPISRNIESTSVLSYMIVILRYVRRVVFEVAAPCVTYVHIERITVSVQFPHSGNRHRSPLGIIERQGLETDSSFSDRTIEREFPVSVQRQCLLLFCYESRPHRQTVDRDNPGVLPILQFIRRNTGSCR